jgi:adenylate cyclase
MAKEIERKFLPREIPSPADGADSVEIHQGYLAIEEDVEVRVRRIGADQVLTVKGGRGEIREEVEIALDMEQFGALWPLTAGRRLAKRRFVFGLGGGLEVELDVFTGELEGLLIAEVEFESKLDSRHFQPPEWFGSEVTGDQRYFGQSLAIRGTPDV